ncbi:ABC transporter ATP-binding protein [Nocardiopsis ansamitocini]|uniref:ABC transporter ATP-binding protein n=1 Tax=Nocardiopsis ansamitocini TaxID=1670832 RepID=A0A9W6P8P1_9ACTN|nr:ABC transporter ATP-binding protein [Nocardiopsis ansamitocini]
MELIGLGKSYGPETAVAGVDLAVEHGELIAILGASGSGKSTLLKMVAGFEGPSRGRILLHGQDVSSLSPADREIGMVVQNYALFPHLSVARNVEYGLRMRKWPKRERAERVAEMLERMRLSALGDRLPRQLSGGQQQRVAIARALAYSPRIMLMDEPLGALDKALKQDLVEEIHRVHREFATTILYVTHDREEAMTLADRVVLMRDGRMAACAPVEELYLRPPTAYAAGFFSGANLVPARVVDRVEGRARVEIGGRTLDTTCPVDPLGSPVTAAVRPVCVVLDPPDDAWALEGEVTDRLFLGDSVQLKLAYSDADTSGVVSCLLPATAPGLPGAVGEKVRFGFTPDTARIVPDDQETR